MTSVINSLIERLVITGTGYEMEYKEEFVQNVLAITQNAVVSMAQKA